MGKTINILKHSRLARIVIYILVIIITYNVPKIINWFLGLNWYMQCWLLACVVIFLFLEVIIAVGKRHKDSGDFDIVDELVPLIADQPTTDDKLGRNEYAAILGKKIISTFLSNKRKTDNTAFAINIEEDYGYGKTSFLMMLKQWFDKHYLNKVVWIEFRPWLCDNTSSLVSEFFRQLAQGADIDVNLYKDIIDYGNALASQVMRKGVGLQLPTLFPTTENSLKSMHDKIKDRVQNEPRLIVVTIDDMDRLDRSEVLSVLKLIRDTADFPNIFYITATEHAYLYDVLKHSEINDPNRYLEKFFNLTFYLPAHEIQFKEEFLKILSEHLSAIPKTENFQKELDALKQTPILQTCFNDLRDVKKFANQLFIYLEVLRGINYNFYDATMICLLQYKCPELYKVLRDRDYLLLTAKSNGNDTLLHLNYNPISEKQAHQFTHTVNKDNGNKEQENEKPILSLSEYLGRSIGFRNEHLGEEILNVLFGENTANGVYAIKRTNKFFIYFSGLNLTSSITKAETAMIMGKEMKSYKKDVDQLFINKRSNAFLHELGYVIGEDKADILDVIRKLFYFMEKQYDYQKEYHFDRANYAINVQTRELYYVLFQLMGDATPSPNRQSRKEHPNLGPIIKEEKLPYVICLISVLNSSIGDFEYSRDDIEGWVDLLFHRMYDEILSKKEFTKEDLSLIVIARNDLISFHANWNQMFADYLCSDIEVAKNWLSSLIIDYGQTMEWNFSVKQVLLGSSYDYIGRKLVSKLKYAYPELTESLSALEELLRTKNLHEISDEIRDNDFVKEFVRGN